MIGYEIAIAVLLPGTSVAWSGTMDNTFANTVVSTDSRGAQSNWYFDADGRYTVKTADGQSGSGEWKLAGDNMAKYGVRSMRSMGSEWK